MYQAALALMHEKEVPNTRNWALFMNSRSCAHQPTTARGQRVMKGSAGLQCKELKKGMQCSASLQCQGSVLAPVVPAHLDILKEVQGKDVPKRLPAIISVVQVALLHDIQGH